MTVRELVSILYGYSPDVPFKFTLSGKDVPFTTNDEYYLTGEDCIIKIGTGGVTKTFTVREFVSILYTYDPNVNVRVIKGSNDVDFDVKPKEYISTEPCIIEVVSGGSTPKPSGSATSGSAPSATGSTSGSTATGSTSGSATSGSASN